MSSNHKDLPPGSQKWASEVDKDRTELLALRDVVRRLADNAGIDMANPKRGINGGDTPSVQGTVGQKLSSLADVSTYNVTDGYVLTWVQKEQRWVPKAKAGGFGPSLPADTWSVQDTAHNVLTDPLFQNSTGGWMVDQGNNNSYVRVDYTIVAGAGRNGGNAMRVDFYYDNVNFPSNSVIGEWRGFAPWLSGFSAWVKTDVSDLTVEAGIRSWLDGGYPTLDSKVLVPGEWTQLWATGTGGQTATDIQLTVQPVPANSPATTIWVDDAYLGDTQLYNGSPFNGNTPADADYDYSWDGALGASTSTRTQRRKIMVPGTISAGARVQVVGQGWASGEAVNIGFNGVYFDRAVASASGAFDASIQLPNYFDPNRMPYLFAENDSGSTSIYVEPTIG